MVQCHDALGIVGGVQSDCLYLLLVDVPQSFINADHQGDFWQGDEERENEAFLSDDLIQYQTRTATAILPHLKYRCFHLKCRIFRGSPWLDFK